MSIFGEWATENGLPVFKYSADPRSDPRIEWDTTLHGRTKRQWVGIGNRRLQLFVDNEGTCGLWDEHDGLRWLTSAEDRGTGVSLVDTGGDLWGTDAARWPSGRPPLRSFGPTWFTVAAAADGLELTRSTYCLEGECPWALIRVVLHNSLNQQLSLTLSEEWSLRPRFVQLASTREQRTKVAREVVTHEIDTDSAAGTIVVQERFSGVPIAEQSGLPLIFGAPRVLCLEALGSHRASARATVAAGPDPVVRLILPIDLAPGQRIDAWFRFGIVDGTKVHNPAGVVERSMINLQRRLPRARSTWGSKAARELPWHAALLTGGACRDGVLGGHTLDQSSTYSMELGFNGAARDPLQHALPLVYLEPDLALSVLRNTCSWADRRGRAPWAIDGAKRPVHFLFDPSDQPLWALWLAAEYAAATGDIDSFNEPLALPWDAEADPSTLYVQLRRQFRYFVDEVGRGERGHVRIMNADWNDLAIEESGVSHEAMIQHGESVLNSAMAAWVLPVWAGLARRFGDGPSAEEAVAIAAELRELVAGEWNGRWFRRAYGPGAQPVGDDALWLEVQPWAILCGAADDEQARSLLTTIDCTARSGSPVGARVKWPQLPPDGRHSVGEGTGGGIWFSINMTLVWAAAQIDPDLARDEWRRMSLSAHTAAYPDVWEGTLSGPDSYNSPESIRPGHTWVHARGRIAMQAFPVNNLHSHCQPLFSYLRLLGVEPTPEGHLRVGDGASFSSAVFELDADGHGSLTVLGPVTVESKHGPVGGGPGKISW
jgi:hypothetical protein